MAEYVPERWQSRLAGLGAGQHLLAHCAAPACSRSAPCNPEPWLREGLGDLPLSAFSERLRCVCVCGARSAWLEASPGPFRPVASPDLYVFR